MNKQQQIEDKRKQFRERVECGIAYCENTAVDEIKQDFKMQEEKNKQIEEMANIIHRTEFVDISGYEEEKIAEELLKYYQPKLPEDSVVLSRKEYEKIVKYLKTYEDKLKNFPNEVNALVDMYNKGRKETAEKILKEQYQECKIAEQDVLKARGGNKNDDYYKGFSLGMTNTKMHIQELAKQFGVEIKE